MIKILHIDDCRDDLELTQMRLARLAGDIEICWALNAGEALDRVEAEEYDCIISDFQLPEIDGLELLRRLRGAGKSIPFIFLTGQGNEEVAAEALRSGADDYFTKTEGFARYDRLVNSIRRVVEANKQRKNSIDAEKALRESEERYRQFLHQITEGIWRLEIDPPIAASLSVDEHLKLIYERAKIAEANDSLARMYGYRRGEDMVGIRLLELHGDPPDPMTIESMKDFIRSGYSVVDRETVEYDKEGERRCFLNNAIGIVDEDRFAIVWGTQRDITQTREAEIALRESEERYREFLKHSTEGIWRVEANPPVPTDLPEDEQIELTYERGVIAEANDAMARMLGYDHGEEMVGITLKDLHGDPPDPKNIEAHREFIRSGYRTNDLETTEIDRDGNVRHMINNVVGIIEDGELHGSWGTQRDITKIREAQAALQTSKEQFKQFFERITDGIWRMDITPPISVDDPVEEQISQMYARSRIAECNDAMARMYGYADRSDMIGKPLVELHGGTDVTQNVEAAADFIRSGYKIREVETRELDKQGKEKYFLNNVESVIKDGQWIATLGTQKDITRRRRIEEDLRRTLESMEVKVQERTAELSAANEQLKLQIAERERAEAALLQSRGELERRVAERTAELLRANERLKREISDREHYEKIQEVLLNISQLLRESDSIREIMVSVHRELGKLVEVRNIYLGLYDAQTDSYRFPYFIDDFDDFENLELTADRPKLVADYVRNHKKAVLLNTQDLEELIKAGEIELYGTMPVSWLGVPLISQDVVLGVLALQSYNPEKKYSLRDLAMMKIVSSNIAAVVEKQRSEAALAKSHKQLSVRSEELSRLNSELESFVYSVSHDLKAPLRHIDGYSSALEEEFKEELAEKGRGFIGRIRQAVSHMGDLIEALLKLYRLSEAEITQATIDMSALAREITDDLGKSSPKRNVSVDIQDGLQAEGDNALIRVILDNLLSNAWKFSSRKKKAKIEFGASLLNGMNTFFVRDNGVGFDQDKHDLLFSPFQRLHSKEEFEGTGIGLATVNRLVRRHGGKIWAESRQGKGATFYFTLRPE